MFSHSLDTSRDWDSLGQSLPVPDHPFHEEIFLDDQPEPLLG